MGVGVFLRTRYPFTGMFLSRGREAGCQFPSIPSAQFGRPNNQSGLMIQQRREEAEGGADSQLAAKLVFSARLSRLRSTLCRGTDSRE